MFPKQCPSQDISSSWCFQRWQRWCCLLDAPVLLDQMFVCVDYVHFCVYPHGCFCVHTCNFAYHHCPCIVRVFVSAGGCIHFCPCTSALYACLYVHKGTIVLRMSVHIGTTTFCVRVDVFTVHMRCYCAEVLEDRLPHKWLQESCILGLAPKAHKEARDQRTRRTRSMSEDGHSQGRGERSAKSYAKWNGTVNEV